MIDKVTKLADLVEQAAESLGKYTEGKLEGDWATRLQLEVAKIRSGDFHGVEQLVATLPHIGTPSEILQQLRNHQSSLNEALSEALHNESEKLHNLLGQITDLANWLQTEYRRSSGQAHAEA